MKVIRVTSIVVFFRVLPLAMNPAFLIHQPQTFLIAPVHPAGDVSKLEAFPPTVRLLHLQGTNRGQNEEEDGENRLMFFNQNKRPYSSAPLSHRC